MKAPTWSTRLLVPHSPVFAAIFSAIIVFITQWSLTVIMVIQVAAIAFSCWHSLIPVLPISRSIPIVFSPVPWSSATPVLQLLRFSVTPTPSESRNPFVSCWHVSIVCSSLVCTTIIYPSVFRPQLRFISFLPSLWLPRYICSLLVTLLAPTRIPQIRKVFVMPAAVRGFTISSEGSVTHVATITSSAVVAVVWAVMGSIRCR